MDKHLLVGMIAVVLLVVFLLWFTHLLENLPQAALAAIIIVAALNLIEIKPLLKVYRVRRAEFFLAIVARLGVLSIGARRRRGNRCRRDGGSCRAGCRGGRYYDCPSRHARCAGRDRCRSSWTESQPYHIRPLLHHKRLTVLCIIPA